MKSTLSVALVILLLCTGTLGLETSQRVTKHDHSFKLDAVRGKDGSISVEMVLHTHRGYEDRSYIALVILEKERILLWPNLATKQNEVGETVVNFQIHDSLAKKAHVRIGFDKPVMYAHQFQISDYVVDRSNEETKKH